MKTALLIATLDTKHEEALYLKKMIEERGCRVKILNTGILKSCENSSSDIISSDEVCIAACGLSAEEMRRTLNKGECIANMAKGASIIAKGLYENGEFDGIIGIGGGAGNRHRNIGYEDPPVWRSEDNGFYSRFRPGNIRPVRWNKRYYDAAFGL